MFYVRTRTLPDRFGDRKEELDLDPGHGQVHQEPLLNVRKSNQVMSLKRAGFWLQPFFEYLGF